jgi:hypothetical protein
VLLLLGIGALAGSALAHSQPPPPPQSLLETNAPIVAVLGVGGAVLIYLHFRG